jgi:hypothetical protein
LIISPWHEWNSCFANKRQGPRQRGDNYKNAKISGGQLKIFSRTSGPKRLDLNEIFLI